MSSGAYWIEGGKGDKAFAWVIANLSPAIVVVVAIAGDMWLKDNWSLGLAWITINLLIENRKID